MGNYDKTTLGINKTKNKIIRPEEQVQVQDKSFLEKIANNVFDYAVRRHRLSDDTIRARLYRNIIPLTYDNVYSRINNAVLRNKKRNC